MTKIEFTKRNNFIVKMELNGHTGFADSGEDILCAGISAISQSAVMGVQNVVKCPNKFSKNLKNGSLCLQLLTEDEKILQKTQILLETALIALEDLQIGNEKFMKVEVCDEIY